MKSIETGQEVPLEAREAVGERIIGERDPRGLALEEFERAPDLLFHGSATPFEFRDAFDYRFEAYMSKNDGSKTLGFGFYTTDSREDATHYSRVRQFDKTQDRFVTPILPFQAKVLDLRWKEAKGFNAPIPHELAEAWRSAFMKYFREKKPREGNIGAIFDAQEIDYVAFLEKASKESAIDLRVLLGTTGSVKLKSPNITSPTWAYMFSDFMMQQGYDGVVYNEGGEGWGNSVASFVFYNLKKIGTRESWNQQK